MKTSVSTTTSFCLLVLCSLCNHALGEPPKPFVTFTQPFANSTVLVAANNQDSSGSGSSGSANWTTATTDNAFAIANGGDEVNLFTGRPGGSSRAMVIPREVPDSKSLVEAEEDMGTMSHILNKAVSGKDNKHAMGIMVHSFGFASGMPRNLFLDGYGAVFFLNVNFPLVGPADKKQEADAKEETSSEWEEAQREIHHPSSQGGFDFNMSTMNSSNGGGEEYDADKVDDLKKDLIVAMKNAVHIRRLKPDDAVTIVVTGRASNGGPKTIAKKTGSGSSRNSATVYTVNATDSRSTRMILRAKKSDLAAFQKDKISIEEFKKNVSVTIY